MTNKEAIIKSMEKVKIGEYETFPIAFTEFCIDMALLISADCDMLLAMDFPTTIIAGEKFDGKAKQNSTFIDIMRVLRGTDLMRHSSLFNQLHHFLDWFLEQEAKDEEGIIWYMTDVLFTAWNEFARGNTND